MEFHLSHLAPVAQAIEAAAKAQTINELHKAIQNYDGHPLAKRETYVPSQMVMHDNPLMLVTEKPEPQDIEAGEPLSGPYGRQMRKALEDVGVDVTELAIVHAVHWTPPNEKTPNNTQIAASRPFLYREIELVQPRGIIALGRVVVNALTGYKDQITPMIGQTMSHKNAKGEYDVFVTWHPAFVLRFPTIYGDSVKQLSEAFERWGTNSERTLPGSYGQRKAA